jgi:hypothetical protein
MPGNNVAAFYLIPGGCGIHMGERDARDVSFHMSVVEKPANSREEIREVFPRQL